MTSCDPNRLSAADNQRPLLAIADLAGGDWLERARQVAARLAEAIELLLFALANRAVKVDCDRFN